MSRSRRSLAAIALYALAVVAALLRPGQAAPPPATGEQRYDGPYLSFNLPADAKVIDSTDVAADRALEVKLAPGSPLAASTIFVLASSSKVNEADVEGVATAWRDARLRNRASWGVRAQGERHTEQSHVGVRRFLRFSDQIGSVLGASRQLMLCGVVSNRLVCAVASGPATSERANEALIVRLLETVQVHKKSDPR